MISWYVFICCLIGLCIIFGIALYGVVKNKDNEYKDEKSTLEKNYESMLDNKKYWYDSYCEMNKKYIIAMDENEALKNIYNKRDEQELYIKELEQKLKNATRRKVEFNNPKPTTVKSSISVPWPLPGNTEEKNHYMKEINRTLRECLLEELEPYIEFDNTLDVFSGNMTYFARVDICND